MLSKLIKHDFHALSRMLIPTNIAILGATILATASLAFSIRSGYNSFTNSPMIKLLESLATLLIVLMVMAIIAAFFFIAFVVFQHFYKNFMTSQGYLTFTLPVKTSSLLWSKLITALIWLAISTVVGIFCLFIFIAFGTSSTSFVNVELLRDIGDIFNKIGLHYTSGGTVLILELIFFVLASTVCFVLQIYLALVIGGAVSQKHKLLAGIGFYFVINTAMGIISTVVQTVFFNSWATKAAGLVTDSYYAGSTYGLQLALDSFVSSLQPYFWLSVGLTVVYSVVFFLTSNYLLKNKLNLS